MAGSCLSLQSGIEQLPRKNFQSHDGGSGLIVEGKGLARAHFPADRTGRQLVEGNSRLTLDLLQKVQI